MATLFNQTNINKDTSLFITRAEVISGLSTLAGDLSGVNLSTLFANPNPLYSTITVNPSGNIQGGAVVAVGSSVGISSTVLTNNKPYSSYNYMLGFRDGTTNYQPIATGTNVIKPSIFTGENHTVIQPTSFNYVNTTGVGTPIMTLNTTNMQAALSNISSINGNPPTGGTTFTTLTGNSLTSAFLAATQVVGVSSLNGVPYQVPFSTGYSQAVTSVTCTSGVAALAFSITLPATYLKPNTTYIYDVPVYLISWPPGSPTGMNLLLGIRLGGNGQINYQIPLYIVNSSQGTLLSLTGIAQTNTTTITTNTIDIILFQNSGSTFTPALQSPTSTGGANVYTIKPLS